MLSVQKNDDLHYLAERENFYLLHCIHEAMNFIAFRDGNVG